jgi:nucleotidyltransferase/DNA polymerase involved in DNA repair
MQQYNRPLTTKKLLQNTINKGSEQQSPQSSTEDEALIAERARLRQGIMHVRIEHFHCSLEEMLDPSLHGQSFIVGTGTGRPNEPGRVLDVSPAAGRLGLAAGMPLRRAHRMAPRTRFLPASYDSYQPMLQQLKERYRAYSRIVESIPISDAFIDLRGCEIPTESSVTLGERLCAEIAEMGLTAMIGIANGKAIAELAALMSRRDGRQGVLYIPPGREASFVQTLPLVMLHKVRAVGPGQLQLETGERTNGTNGANSHPQETENKNEQIDPVAIAELVAHLRDFGITTFAQVASLAEEGLTRRLGLLGNWVYHVASGEDNSLVVPDAPPMSQSARVRFQHIADADETCGAIRKLADYLADRLEDQHIKGQSIALILWPHRPKQEARREEDEEITKAEETISGQMLLARHTDEADIIAHHSLMLFAHYHRSGMHYLQVQLRVGDIIMTTPAYYPPPARSRGKLTRKL